MPLAAKAETDSCVKCHLEKGGKQAQPLKDMKGDIHDSRGISCAGCHLGDPTSMDAKVAMDPEKGFVGKPGGEVRINMCARCHGDPQFMKQFNPSLRVDQAELYWTSIHGKRLREGDHKPATCSSCHGHHGIYAPTDTRSSVYPTNLPDTCGRCHSNAKFMEQYGIPTNQLEEYKQSVHADRLLNKGDLSSPACNDCHGNHGAAPPGIGSLAYVCSRCHPLQEAMFATSPHGRALKEYGTPTCADCHLNHKVVSPTDEMIGISDGAICTACHSEGDGGWQVAKLLRNHLESLKNDIEKAGELLNRAEDHGMHSVDWRYDLSQAESKLVLSRTLLHSFSLATVEETLSEGTEIARSAQEAARKFFEELKYRKAGLWVTWFFIAIFILAIILKIRDLKSEE